MQSMIKTSGKLKKYYKNFTKVTNKKNISIRHLLPLIITLTSLSSVADITYHVDSAAPLSTDEFETIETISLPIAQSASLNGNKPLGSILSIKISYGSMSGDTPYIGIIVIDLDKQNTPLVGVGTKYGYLLNQNPPASSVEGSKLSYGEEIGIMLPIDSTHGNIVFFFRECYIDNKFAYLRLSAYDPSKYREEYIMLIPADQATYPTSGGNPLPAIKQLLMKAESFGVSKIK